MGESSVTVLLLSVQSFIGVHAECVQWAAFKHTLSEAAMLNIHLCAGVKLGFVMSGALPQGVPGYVFFFLNKPLNVTLESFVQRNVEIKSYMICALQGYSLGFWTLDLISK